MASKVHEPPQTYSRLFRPWDTSNKNSDHSEESNSSVMSEDHEKNVLVKNERSSMNSSKIRQTPPHLEMSPNKLIETYRVKMEMARVPTTPTPPFMYPTMPDPSTMAYLGLDPYALSMMEQEYARVLAEEAAAKQLSAKKQRPKKFKCPHCDVAFSNNGQLKGHIRIHTGERPFKCDDPNCGKTFTRNEELTRHKRIHTGLRPFACPTCNKSFGRRDHLKKHTKTHMAQERYQFTPAAMFLPIYSPYVYGY